jgi:hypothetical protein
MALLKAIYETEADIPAKYRELYAERDGKWEPSEIEGIKTQTDVDKLNESLRKERNDHGKAKDKLRPYEALGEIADLTAKLDKYPELEASAGKIDDAKLDQIVQSRVAAKLAPVERERDALRTEAETLKSESRTRKLQDAVRRAAAGKIAESAMDDALLLGERVLDVRDDGLVVTRDGVGVTPGLNPDEWLAEVLPKREHWLPASLGGGARGSKNGNGFANNPWAKDNWNLTNQGKYIQEHGAEKAAQAAAAAGSSVGATQPKA